jgi:hypothetical protein
LHAYGHKICPGDRVIVIAQPHRSSGLSNAKDFTADRGAIRPHNVIRTVTGVVIRPTGGFSTTAFNLGENREKQAEKLTLSIIDAMVTVAVVTWALEKAHEDLSSPERQTKTSKKFAREHAAQTVCQLARS